MKFSTKLTMCIITIFITSSLYSETVLSSNDLILTGEGWMGAQMNLTKNQGNATGLTLDRIQVNFDKRVSDMFTAALKIERMGSSHASGYVTSDNGDRIYVGDIAFGLYLKEATLKITPLNGIFSAFLIAGIPETPSGQFIENQKGDYMFNIDDTEFTEKYTDEKKYDPAIGIGGSYNRFVDIYFTMGHGDGYKNLGGANAPDYKWAYNGRITVTPLDSFKISGFFTLDNHKPQDEWVKNNEGAILTGAIAKNPYISDYGMNLKEAINTYFNGGAELGDLDGDGIFGTTNDYYYLINGNASLRSAIIRSYVDSTDIKSGIYGGGIGWNDGSIRTGFNYFYITQKIADKKSQMNGDQIFDLWANANLKKYIGLSFAVYGGYSYMKDKNTKIKGVSVEDEGKAIDTYEWFTAAGYEFSDQAGFYIFYREFKEKTAGFDPEKFVKIMGIFKF